MYSFTNPNSDLYIHIKCECNRYHNAEEMYICFNCNKVLCSKCPIEEVEYCYCKNNCRRNQYVQVGQTKNLKNSCDQCMECPNCRVVLNKKVIDGKYLYACSYCSWDTTSIKFVSKEENDIEMLIYQLKESSVKGYLKKNYDLVLSKLKESIESKKKATVNRTDSMSRFIEDEDDNDNDNDNFNKAISNKVWESCNLDESLKKKELDLKNSYEVKYNDNYIQDKNRFAFQAVVNFLHASIDFSDRGLNKIENLDSLKEKLKNEYDISLLASVETRMNNIISQYPLNQ